MTKFLRLRVLTVYMLLFGWFGLLTTLFDVHMTKQDDFYTGVMMVGIVLCMVGAFGTVLWMHDMPWWYNYRELRKKAREHNREIQRLRKYRNALCELALEQFNITKDKIQEKIESYE